MAGVGSDTGNTYSGSFGVGIRNGREGSMQPVERKNSLDVVKRVGTGDSITLYTSSTTDTIANMVAPKKVSLENVGTSGASITLKFNTWGDNTTQSGEAYIQMILAPGEKFEMPTTKVINTDSSELLDGTIVDFTAPDSSTNVVSGATVNNGEGGDHVINSASATNLWLAEGEWTDGVNGSFLKFRNGDLIRIGAEIMEITGIGSGVDGTNNNYLTVRRGVHGSTATTHTNGDNISFPFFNNYHEFDDTSYNGGGNGSATLSKTDSRGRFSSSNFFGLGRTTGVTGKGIVPGTVAFVFYESGYQGMGVAGAYLNQSSGLAKSTLYYVKVSIDASTAQEISFTTDSSTVDWGGKNGIINKVNDALRTSFDDSTSNMFGRYCSFGLRGGDLVFTSGSHLSTSAIAITAGTSGAGSANEWFDGATGRIPASPRSAVDAVFPSLVRFDRDTNEETPNSDVFMYDDCKGNLIYKGGISGSINYETGAFDFAGPANAEFKYAVGHTSALAGAVEVNAKNTIDSITGRSTHAKVNGFIKVQVTG